MQQRLVKGMALVEAALSVSLCGAVGKAGVVVERDPSERLRELIILDHI
jgi:hypothetical protein